MSLTRTIAWAWSWPALLAVLVFAMPAAAQSGNADGAQITGPSVTRYSGGAPVGATDGSTLRLLGLTQQGGILTNTQGARLDIPEPLRTFFLPPADAPMATVIIDVFPDDAPWMLVDARGITHEGIGDVQLTNVAPGSYTLTWLVRAGYAEPVQQTVVREATEGETSSVVGYYISQGDPPLATYARLMSYLLGQHTDATDLDQNSDGLVDIADYMALQRSDGPAAPALVQPTEGTVGIGSQALLLWAGAARATSYDLYLWRDGDTPTTPTQTGLTTLQCEVAALNPHTQYHWQIRANNTLCGALSPVWSFITGPLPGLEIVEPHAAATWRSGGRVELQWRSLCVPLAGWGVRFELWRAGSHVAELGRDWDTRCEGQPTCEKRIALTLPTLAPGEDYHLRIYSAWLENQGKSPAYLESAFAIRVE